MWVNKHHLHPRVPSVVFILPHERIVEFLETVHDCRHVLFRRQDSCPQVEHPNLGTTNENIAEKKGINEMGQTG